MKPLNSAIRSFRSLILAVGMCIAFAAPASACPNCKATNDDDKRAAQGYMYSILFMIGMPATLFTGFGISFYRMTKRAAAAAEAEAIDAGTE